MEDTKDKILPGTAATYIVHGEKGFKKIEMLLDATGGLSLSQVCAVTGLEGSTIQNWVKRGWVAHPEGKRYEEVHIARILVINALKECIKLEHIAQLMLYVNGESEDFNDEIIREKDLFNYLCDALQKLGQVDDLSRRGVESVVEAVIKDYESPAPHARTRIRKALTVMIYACVCTDVKRRTEAMMRQVLRELEDPSGAAELWEIEPENDSDAEDAVITPASTEREDEQAATSGGEEPRKTIAQALREWDLAQVENIINEDSEDSIQGETIDDDDGGDAAAIEHTPVETPEKPAQKPWYFRRN